VAVSRRFAQGKNDDGLTCGTEYRTKFITRTFGGNAYYGCYALAVTIFSLGIFRDFLYVRHLHHVDSRSIEVF
jgi:hypothetical protein